MRKFWSWFKAFLRWFFVEPRIFWFTLAGLAAALIVLIVGYRLGMTLEATIRIAGLCLQLLGILTVAWGIHKTRKLFGLRSIFADSRQWVSHFPRFRGRQISLTSSMAASSTTSTPDLNVWIYPGPNATIEERVNGLEENLQDVNRRLCGTKSEVDQRLHEQTQNLKHEQDTRSNEDKKTRKMLETTQTGGLQISAMGALWLFFGVLLSTISMELAKLLIGFK